MSIAIKNKGWSRAYERGFSRYIGPGSGEPRRGLWISEGPYSLNHRRFIWIFFLFVLVFSTIFSLFRKHNSDFWWKFTSGFIGLQILNFERSPSLSTGSQNNLVPPCKISLEGPDIRLIFIPLIIIKGVGRNIGKAKYIYIYNIGTRFVDPPPLFFSFFFNSPLVWDVFIINSVEQLQTLPKTQSEIDINPFLKTQKPSILYSIILVLYNRVEDRGFLCF